MPVNPKREIRRGQTSVEYLLLVALIVGVAMIVNQFFAPSFMNAVRSIVTDVQTEAWSGGEASQNPERPYQNYYSNNQGICVHTDGDSACR